jgi:hypothetical protein
MIYIIFKLPSLHYPHEQTTTYIPLFHVPKKGEKITKTKGKKPKQEYDVSGLLTNINLISHLLVHHIAKNLDVAKIG